MTRRHNVTGVTPFPVLPFVGFFYSPRSRLSEELQSLPSQTYPSAPDPLRTSPSRPDSDPILTRFGPEIRLFRVRIGSKSGQNRVQIRSGGRGSEGVGSRKVGPAGKAPELLRKVLTPKDPAKLKIHYGHINSLRWWQNNTTVDKTLRQGLCNTTLSSWGKFTGNSEPKMWHK